jgi:hypothetical protein
MTNTPSFLFPHLLQLVLPSPPEIATTMMVLFVVLVLMLVLVHRVALVHA